MHKHARRLGLGIALLGASALVAASDRDELVDAFEKAMDKGRYSARIDTQVNGRPYGTEMQVIFPDRYHLRTPDTEMVILPQGTWMNAGGQWMKMPINMSQQIASYSREAMKRGMASVSDVVQQGSETINGCESDLYRYRASGEFMGVKDSTQAVAAICRDSGLPVRVVSTGSQSVTIHYDFESEVSIEAPN
ncbi:hypothetical protein [Pseudomarimonas salicorniae]|uniref:Outer membrane lipoprotein-sorting protein n=1 Tax=Pseudomarimonas salicorniae TaxID=2933270 RepID=A0ABT0GHR1_9GAMM|nr:hypothetical protein [Lysobacter sp. CAU 1642]MCK7594084.1 hypothetical protein [Lysobacter sp. CAU 1642]